MWDTVKRMVLVVVNNSFERAIKEDSLSESSTKSTTSHSITVWKTGRWACECWWGEAGWDAGEECSLPSTLATGDSRISINPDYKSNSLNTKVTRKGNPTHTTAPVTVTTTTSAAAATTAGVQKLSSTNTQQYCHGAKYQTGQRKCINFPKVVFLQCIYTRDVYNIMQWIKLPRAMLINKRRHYCEFIYINTTVVVILSLRKTRLSRIIKVQGARVCVILLYYMRAYTVRTRDCLRWRDSNSPSPKPLPNLTPKD